jgi:hypothetical protein
VLDAYLLWNAYAEYKLCHNGLVIFADAKNITNNRDYVEVYGYNVQGLPLTQEHVLNYNDNVNRICAYRNYHFYVSLRVIYFIALQ